jgi:hypothetical protein
VSARTGRRRVSWLCLVALSVIALVAAPAAREYRTVELDGLKVTIDTDWVPRAAPGYLPVRFEITNAGRARVIEIVGQGSRFFRPPPRSGNASMFVRQSVRLAPGDRVRLTMPIPIFADSENIRFEIREEGRTIERFGYGGLQSRVKSADASVLVVGDPQSEFGRVATRLLRTMSRTTAASMGVYAVLGSSGGGGSTSLPPMDFQLEPSRLPTNWLGYTSVRAVAIGSAEWTGLSDAQKSALLTWTSGGGDLIFVDGDVGTVIPSAKGQPATNPERVVYRHLLGRIHALSTSTLLAAGLVDTLTAATKSSEVNWALPANTALDWGVIERRGFRLRIPGIEGVPARVYLLILGLFTLLIGPANYWLLWRKRRQVLLVLTAPLISLAFIVLLAGYALAGEGFHIRGRAMTFTVLDQAAKQAATRASVSLYAAGLTPAGGLRVGRDVAVFPLGPDGVGTRDRLSLDLTETQLFAGGVLQARSPTNFEQITVRTARERLAFSREPGGLSVANGLEASVLALLYRDVDAVYRLDGALTSGGKQALRRVLDPQQALPADISLASKFLYLVRDQPRGSYLAVLDRSPFWEPGVTGLVEQGSLHVVLGWPEGQQ